MDPNRPWTRWAKRGAGIVALSGLYFLAGRIGLTLPYHDSGIALIWLPAGLALGALLRFGLWCWPGISLGVLWLNLLDSAAWQLAVGFMVSNTVGPVLAAWLLRKVGFHAEFDRRRDIGFLVALGGVGQSLTALLGVMWLGSQGLVPAVEFRFAWGVWWLADLMGVVVVVPPVLLLTRRNIAELQAQRWELSYGLAGGVVAIACAWLAMPIFGVRDFALLFLPILLVAWSALRLGAMGFACTLLGAAVITAWGVITGLVPFSHPGDMHSGLALWWCFMGTLFGIGWLITDLRTEQRKTVIKLQQAHTVLSETEERLELAVRGADLSTWDWDVLSGVICSDARLGNWLGSGAGQNLMRIEDWKNRVHPDDLSALETRMDAHLHGEATTYEAEYRVRAKSGDWVWLQDRGRIIERDAQGRPVRLAGTHMDITARKAAEAAAATQQGILGLVLDHAPLGIWLQGADQRLRFVNRSFCTALGIAEEKFKSVPHYGVLFDEATARSCMASDETALAQPGPHVSREQLRYADGKLHDLEIIKSRLESDGGELLGILGIAIDITDRLQAEQTMQLQSAALQVAANGIMITDRGGRIEWVNRAYLDIIGYTEAETLGRNPRELVHSGVQDREFYAAMWRTICAGKTWHGELVNRRKDGTLFTEEQTITPLVDVRGEIRNFIAIVQDITLRRRMEEEKRRIEEQFRQAQKMEAIGRLSGGVAHDFNNILTAILGNASLVLQEPCTREEQVRCLSEIVTAAQRASALTQQLLAFSRRQKPNFRTVDLRDIVADMSQMLLRIVGEDVLMEFTRAPEPLPVSADRSMIEQVLLNLAVNARDAMPQGGRLEIITAAVGDQEVSANGGSDTITGRFARLRVRDNGCGISPEHLPKIFDPFFTTKRVGQGTGLGLSTVYGLVEQHHGHVRVESQPGHGATFDIILPLTSLPGKKDVAAGAVIPRTGQGETIFIVEDDEVVRRMLALTLNRAGYKIVEAHSGRAALAMWPQIERDIALLLTDLVMPEGVNGLELAGELQRRRPGLRVIVSSGYNPDRHMVGMEERPGITFLAKPYPADKLIGLIRELLG